MRGVSSMISSRGDSTAVAKDKSLGNDGPEVQRELQIDLRMSLHREKVHDAFDGLVGIIRCKVPEAEVTCFRERNGGFHGFRIPDFADEDHVGACRRVFLSALPNEWVSKPTYAESRSTFVMMDELDRVFHTDDVPRVHRIPVIDHGGQGRRLS